MASLEEQNPFAPPRADVDDIGASPDGDLVLADRGKRFAAYLIDLLLPFVLGMVAAIAGTTAIFGLWGADAQNNASTSYSASQWFVFGGIGLCALGWVVYNLVLVYQQGQTFGKRTMGIRMVRTDGSRMSFARFFFLRVVAILVLQALPWIGRFVWLVDYLLIFRDSHQCLHDTLADTVVATAESTRHATLAGSRAEPLRTTEAEPV